MDKRTFGIISFLLLTFLIGGLVSAATIQFIDAAQIGNGTLTITSPDNQPVAVLHSSEGIELHNGTAYMFDYQPSGFVTLDTEVVGFDFPILKFLLSFFSIPENLIALFVVVVAFLLLVAALG